MSAELYLARRYLITSRHGTWGLILSCIATGSVALGVAALIVTLSVMTGFREDIQNKMLGVHPHILISSFTGKMNPETATVDSELRKNKDIVSWAPFVSGQVLIGRGKQSAGATIKGIVPDKERQVANLGDRLTEGQWTDLTHASGSKKTGKPKLILGRELARQIGARLGDTVWIVTPHSIGISGLSVPQAHLFEVSGLLQTGLYDYDSVLIYADLTATQNLFGLGQQITGYGVRVGSNEDADQVARELQKSFEGNFWVRSWLSQNKNLFSALKLERTVMFIILTLLTVVAAFMIITNLLLNISQKVKDIGILRAMGAPQGFIKRVFLYQGLLMGIIGNIIGSILGVSISLFLSKTNIIRLPADVYYIDHLPIHILPFDILFVVFVSLLIVLLATFYPAHKAAHLDPLDAIRYG